MVDRLVLDVTSGTVDVSVWLDGELPSPVGSLDVPQWPLGGEELGRLRWYLEDYLSSPYGVWGDQGPEIADGLRGWGEGLFDTVFGAGAVRDAYVVLRDRPGQRELLVRSSDVSVLRLPWELLWDPARPRPVSLDWDGVARSLPATTLAGTHEPSTGRLKVLMVIARPAGEDDIGYQMIARPLLPRLEAVAGRVELRVLRPSTFDALQTTLREAAEAGDPFQVVHFDGHGTVGAGPGWQPAPGQFHDATATGGMLAFEPDTGEDEALVSATSFAAAVTAGGVPLVVLNACQSAAMGAEAEAAVATSLLGAGVGSVVAMGYSVYATAAAEFMATLYERLFAGDRVSQAVSAGRRRLLDRPERDSPKGKLRLDDWLVPVHYQRRAVSFPQLHRPTVEQVRGGLDLADVLDRIAEADDPDEAGGGPLAPVGEFVGRDREFYRLEQAALHHRGVVVHGPGGTGKTELAKAFGRWWLASGGVDDPDMGVVWHSFEPGVATFGVDGLVAAAGAQLFGPPFSQLEPDLRRAVVDAFRRHRLLWVWDNFESVHSMPDPDRATPPLDDDGRAALRRLLDEVAAAGGRSLVLVTSRSSEGWLDQALPRLPLGRLATRDVNTFADQLLKGRPAAEARRQDRAFGELLEVLDGSPLAMRIMLPQLESTDPAELVAALSGEADLPPGFEADAGRTASLGASVAYSLRHLDDDVQRRLAAVSLFTQVVDADVLGAMSQQDGIPDRFADVDTDTWVATLDQATAVGLLTSLGANTYRIHPALPAYLSAAWRGDAGDRSTAEHDGAEDALTRAYAGFCAWLHGQIRGGDATLAHALVGQQQTSIGRALGHALDARDFAAAQAITQPLDDHWVARGLVVEADSWTDRIRDATETDDGTPPDLDTAAGGLWLFVISAQATRQIRAHQLDDARQTYLDLLSAIEAQPPSDTRSYRLGVAYHQLGTVAEERGDLDDAERWYRRSLDIKEERGDRPGMASSYHQLGRVAQERGDLDDAHDWYRKSLDIEEQLGNRPGMATSYHQLGIVGQLRGNLDDAERWYRRSLDIKEQLRDRPGMASSYHQLGRVAELRGDLDDAERWYRRSLDINEQLGDRPGMASSYHQLGIVAQLRGDLDHAERWYRRSLGIMEQLGSRPRMASSYHQLGIVAQLRGDLDHAERWYRRSLDIFEQLGNRPGMADSYHQLGIVAQKRGDLDDAHGWYRKSLDIKEQLGNRPGLAMSYGQMGLLAEERGDPPAALVWTVRCVTLFDQFPHPSTGPAPGHLARLTDKLGVEALDQVWRDTTGQPVPDALSAWLVGDDG